MSTASPAAAGPGDAELVAGVRAGRIAEYGVLRERHVGAANRLARRLCRSAAEADTVVSDSFATMLDVLRDGAGPDVAVRPYLLSTVRHTAGLRGNPGTGPADGGGRPTADPWAREQVGRDPVTRAFARLPERWQTVLWHTVVEQEHPAEVAPMLGITPDAVTALAHRAGEGVRREYLQLHLAKAPGPRCRATAAALGARARDGLSHRERAQVEHHLDGCAHCHVAAGELARLDETLRGVLALLVLGAAAPGYLAGMTPTADTAGPTVVGTDGNSAGAGGGDGRGGARAPRRFLGVAVSGLAMTTAVAVALTTGGHVPESPLAGPDPGSPPTATREPGTAPDAPPDPGVPPPPTLPTLPTLPVPQPDPGSYRPPEPTDTAPRGPETPATTPPTTATSPEPDPRPRLTVDGPTDGVTLDAGGASAELVVTVRNEGSALTDPSSLTWTLPDGLSMVTAPDGGETDSGETDGDETDGSDGTEADRGTGGGGAGAGGTGDGHTPDDPALDDSAPGGSAPGEAPDGDRDTGVVECPGGTGTVTCRAPGALEPGESVSFRHRVRAGAGADSAEITGTVRAGGVEAEPLSVPVTVERPPDVAHLAVEWEPLSTISVEVRNDGVLARPAGLRVDRYAVPLSPPAVLECGSTPLSLPDLATGGDRGTDRDQGSLRCRTGDDSPLAPGESVSVSALVPLRPAPADPGVTVTATVGSDTVSETVHPENCPPGLPTGTPTPPVSPTPPTSPTPSTAPSVPAIPDPTVPDPPVPDLSWPDLSGPDLSGPETSAQESRETQGPGRSTWPSRIPPWPAPSGAPGPRPTDDGPPPGRPAGGAPGFHGRSSGRRPQVTPSPALRSRSA